MDSSELEGAEPRRATAVWDGYAFADPSGRITRALPDFCRIVGGVPAEWEGRSVLDCFEGKARESLRRFLDSDPTGVEVWLEDDLRTAVGAVPALAVLFSVPETQARGGRFLALQLMLPRNQVKRRSHVRSQAIEATLSFEQMTVGLVIVGLDRRMYRCNAAACEIFGATEEELSVYDFGEALHPDHALDAVNDYVRLVAGYSAGYEAERRYVRPDNSEVWVHERVSLVRGPDGRPSHYLWQIIDITARVKAEQEIRIRERKLDFLTNTLPTPIIEVDARGTVISANDNALEGTGRPDLVGTNCKELIHDDDWLKTADAGLRAIDAGEDWYLEFRIRLPDGTERWVNACSRGHFHDDGTFRSITSTWSDITERKRNEAELEQRANKDSLTGLLNRDAFSAALEAAVAAEHDEHDSGAGAGAGAGSAVTALLFVDLDGFKQVNDSRGHAAGDDVLEQVARRLVDAARRGDLVGRWGGDEFVLLCRDLADRADAREISERVIEAVDALGADLSVEGFGASVGVAFVADHPSVDAVLSSADRLVYRAKADGGGSVRLA